MDLIALEDYQQILQHFGDAAVPQSEMNEKARRRFIHGVPDADQIILEGVVAAHQKVHGDKMALSWLESIMPEIKDPLRRARIMGLISWYIVATDSPDHARAHELAQVQFDHFPWHPRARGQLGIALIENHRDAEGMRLLREADQMNSSRLDPEGAALRKLWMALSLTRGSATEKTGGAMSRRQSEGAGPEGLLNEAARALGADHPQVLWMRQRIGELSG